MVNTKLFYNDKVYGHTEAVVDLLRELGVRIVRERITTGSSSGTRKQQRAMLELAGAGIRWHGTVGGLDEWSDADAVNRGVMRHLESYYGPRVDGDLSALMHSFGGCNEVDGPVVNGRRDPEWAAHAPPCSGPSGERPSRAPRPGRSPWPDRPPARTSPSRGRASSATSATAATWATRTCTTRATSPTQNLDEHLATLRHCFPHVSDWVFTETGYNNSPQANLGRTVPEFASASYAVRGICDFFRRRAIYGRFELLDDPDPIDHSTQASINRTVERDAHFGLVAMTRDTVRASTPDTWRKKPEFYATKRFLRLMADPGRSFTPDDLRLELSGGGDDLQQELVQKRDGTHYLLLWRDVEVATLYPDGERTRVDSTRVTVRLGTARPVAVYEPRSSDRAQATYSPRSAFDVRVAGDLVVVEIG